MTEVTVERFANLVQHCAKLLELADRWLRSTIAAKHEDHLAFMLVTFTAKQRLHFESMGVLASAGCYADLATIARVMLDGLVVLKWAASDPEERPLAWRAYALVADYEILQARRTRGEAIDPEHEKDLLARLEEHGTRFLNKQPSKDGGSRYRSRWSLGEGGKQVTIEQMMTEIGADPLYDLYHEWSGWIHWNVRGIGRGVHRDGSRVAYRWHTESAAAAPLAVGFQALVETMQLLDEHFDLNRRTELDGIVASYLKDQQLPEAAT